MSAKSLSRLELAQELKREKRIEADFAREEKRREESENSTLRAFQLRRAAEKRALFAMVARHEAGRDAVAVKSARRIVETLESEYDLPTDEATREWDAMINREIAFLTG